MKNTATHMNGLVMADFLREYWQKRPCVIKQFIPAFEDPIDENDLAGLAQEDDVDSRLVSYACGQWHVTQGPIEDFEPLCIGAWTLLVQGVDRFISEVDDLSDIVKQIGNWRMDDIMVSYSTAGAGVGAHIDQYDVFIVQGKGSRRWQVGLPSEYETLMPHPLLKQIGEFTPIIDEVLQTGDAIYIPPKHPHNGVALSDCLNYSIGFRAPTNLELLNGLVDEGEDLEAVQQHYTDEAINEYRAQTLHSAIITDTEITRLREAVVALIHSDQAQHALMQVLSRQSLPDMRPDQTFELAEVEALLQSGLELVKAPGVKPIYAQSQTEDFVFYIDGQAFTVSGNLAANAMAIINGSVTLCQSLSDKLQNQEYAALLIQLLNEGYVDFADV